MCFKLERFKKRFTLYTRAKLAASSSPEALIVAAGNIVSWQAVKSLFTLTSRNCIDASSIRLDQVISAGSCHFYGLFCVNLRLHLYVCLGKAKDCCSCLMPLTPLHIFSRNNESRHHPLWRDWFVISSLLINEISRLKSALKLLSEDCSDLQSLFPLRLSTFTH